MLVDRKPMPKPDTDAFLIEVRTDGTVRMLFGAEYRITVDEWRIIHDALDEALKRVEPLQKTDA